MDYFEKYEQDCKRIREENKALLDDFEKWLSDKGMSPKTIAKHSDSVSFYINEFLLYEEAISAADGVTEIRDFLGYWFIKKALWANKSRIKSFATSLKKFYGFMLERGYIQEESYSYLKKEIKSDMQGWLDTMDRYDDPDIEDMEEVWGI